MTEILTLNAGSSSIKFLLSGLDDDGGLQPLMSGKIEKIGVSPVMTVRSAQGGVLRPMSWTNGDHLTHGEILADFLHWLSNGPVACTDLGAVGHRVVHGGDEFVAPALVDSGLLEKLDALSMLAPLHQSYNVQAIRALATLAPDVPQVACFDTAFHHDRPAVSTRFALPREFHDKGIRRFGFHGISYEFIARELAHIAPELSCGRVIAAHLGNGASLCAMRNGMSIDTTMGFTALDGLVMGTRCGSIDPGVLLYLQLELGLTALQLQDMLYRHCGLLGVSGLSSDMRELESSSASEATEAIELFAWRAVREIGALTASLGGLDAIIFTAGIGENDASMRRRICNRLAWLGIELDEGANEANARYISTPASRVAVLVIPTDEERMIALHTSRLLAQLRMNEDGARHERIGAVRAA